MRVGAGVAHHAHGAEVGEDGEILGERAAQVSALQLVAEDVVGLAHLRDPVAGDGADDAHGQAGTGERLALGERGGQVELAAQRPDLVLEKTAQRLDEFIVHIRRQPADVVVRLDRGRLPAAALDYVGIDCPLR